MLSAGITTYRNAYSGLSRSTWLLSLIMLINRSGTMVVPFMTLYLTSAEVGYSVSQAGFVFGLFGAGAFVGAWFGGKLTDRIGFYPVQMATLLGGGTLFILLGQMHSFPMICIFTFLVSFVNEAFRPANSTAIVFYSKPENRTRSYALNRLAVNLGWAVGSVTGGALAEINYELLFWVDGFSNIGAALLMWFFIRPVSNVQRKAAETDSRPALPAHKDKQFILFIIVTGFFACCFFQVFTNLPVHFRNNLHFSEAFIGLLMAVNGILIALIEMVLVYKLEGKRNNLLYISTGVTMVGLGFILLQTTFMPALVCFAMIVLITLGEILAMPFMNSYWIGRAQPSNRGQYAGLYTMAWSAAQTIGPMVGAQVADHWGFSLLFWLISLICISAAFLFHRMRQRQVQRPDLLQHAA
jgi:predicted MFS family arabinose efflux permease